MVDWKLDETFSGRHAAFGRDARRPRAHQRACVAGSCTVEAQKSPPLRGNLNLTFSRPKVFENLA
eukprot:9380279-Pyramimonas_sp.AAC.1